MPPGDPGGRKESKVSADLRRIIHHSDVSVDSTQLLSDIIKEWGGTKNLAKDIKQSFDFAPEGSMIKQRFLEMVQRLIVINTMHDLSEKTEPSEMTDAELNDVATHYVEKVASKGEGHVEAGDTGQENRQEKKGAPEGGYGWQEDCAGYGSTDVEAELQPTEPDEWDF